jgi:hypothetical protein
MKQWRPLFVALVLLLSLAALPLGALAAPTLVVSPGSGPRGTAIGASATGLEPDTRYLIQVVRGSGNVNTVRVFEEFGGSDARGEMHFRIGMNYDPGIYTVRIVAIGGLVLATAPFTVTPGGPPGGERHFPETGHSVRGRFLAYWQSHGVDLGESGISDRESLALFGYPISGEFEQRLENGRTYTVQYFERFRMEFHPEHEGTASEVLLGHFGRHIVAGVPNAPTAPVQAREGFKYHPETGHNVGPRFHGFWERNGGLAQFGYPLTELFTQTLEDGKRYEVQYFERARFEWHQGNPAEYSVLLGHFGRTILAETTDD